MPQCPRILVLTQSPLAVDFIRKLTLNCDANYRAQSVPDLMQHVMSLAWMNRKVQPIVQIKGGVIAVRSEKCLLWILHQQVTPVQSGGPPRTPLSTRRLEPPWVARR
eukprot:m.151820 g.151820  ORF g.151820 m.151820 type:complete len:107 (-) comp14308_c0_seq1:534-854(-)